MYYDHFVLPFTIGLNVLIIFLIVKYIRWIRTFSRQEKKLILKGMVQCQNPESDKRNFSGKPGTS